MSIAKFLNMVSGFSIDLFALGIALAAGTLFFLFKRRNKNTVIPSIYFSNLNDLKNPYLPHPRRAFWAPNCAYSALLFFTLAFIDPHLQIEKKAPTSLLKRPPTEGIAIYMLLDQSGSMSEKIQAVLPHEQWGEIAKIDLLKQVTAEFIRGNPSLALKGRPSDLIGIVAFARVPQVLAPLTLDHAYILDELAKLHVVQNQEQDGTAIGYAIYKTVNLIEAARHFAQDLKGQGRPSYEIKNSIMILVTDGFQDPNILDKDNGLRTMDPVDAAEYAKEMGIRLYIVNVEPKMSLKEFALQRKLLQRTAELTGGKFYLADSSNSLQQIYAEIDQLEKSELPDYLKIIPPPSYQRLSFYPYLIALGLLALFLSITIDTIIVRKFP